jgi:UDP:flavonoid glycosyltransferase YjiC (YdhE family)
MALLGAGKPALYIPLHLEQVLTAHAINQLELGKAASPRKPEQVALRLLELLNNPSILETTTQFARQLSEINHSEKLSLALDRLAICAK